MGDPFGRWSNPAPHELTHDSPQLQRSNSFARPSGKTIYSQRKDYAQSLFEPGTFQHHVEHLLTMRLEQDIRSTDDCIARLKALEAQGRVWGQDLMLQVREQALVLSDMESKEELDSYPLAGVQECSAVLDSCGYDSVLTVCVQERSPPGTSVLLFQCDRPGAGTLKTSLEQLVKQCKEEQRSQYSHRTTLEAALSRPPSYARAPSGVPERWAESPEPNLHAPSQHGPPSSDCSEPRRSIFEEGTWGEQGSQQTAWLDAQNQPLSDMERDTEVLNHVLGDVELFVHQLRAALGSASSKNLWKKKKKIKGKNLPPEADYRDFFQKVKYALNLMGKLRGNVEKPSIPELLHLLFTTLSFVLGHCPNSSLAPSVESPLLIQAAVDLLEDTLHQQDYSTWKNLGIAWNKTRAEYPDGDSVPAYTPVFSDGWLPPSLAQPGLSPPAEPAPATSHRDGPNLVPPPFPPVLMQAMYEFRGRNAQELTVQKGDTLQVLDQRKKWYLVQNSQGEKGYIPSNILEPLGQDSMSQGSPPSLHNSSTPAEVTAWLKDKGFSQITVKCLGVLSGHQLLHMSPEELRAVCPEEWRRIIFKLSAVKTSLGIGPRD
ncbi:epidermal growth factor receptor kinase substrate 8-like protein 3 isoform X2 [Struthio camelus]|uniref:epidermal growth factor receptor kinase substrate 8-like protein 3 isoform X2 n=1 Tax=Struthio camelus TaxID=8801 RepID=UPI003604072E